MHQGYYIFNLKEAVQLIKQKMWFILLLSFCGFLIAFGITKVFLKPVYTSKVSFYVSNTEHLQNKIDFSDINAAQKLANTYSVIIQSDTVLSEVVSLSSLSHLTPLQIKRMMTVKSVSNTEVIEVHITTRNPQLSADVANAIASIAPSKIKEITKTGDVEIIDKAVPNLFPSSPNLKFNCILGVLAGMVLSFIFVIAKNIFDTRIRDEADVKRYYDIPVLGSIPAFDAAPKGGYRNYGR